MEDRIAPASAKAAFGLETAGGHVPAHVTLPTADEDDGGDDGDDDDDGGESDGGSDGESDGESDGDSDQP